MSLLFLHISAMVCSFRARVNQLWSIWYTVAMVLLQVYLIYLGFERYHLYSEMKWPHGAYPSLWLSVYIILYFSCIPGLLLFTAFGIFKSGNIAGDNDRLGARIDRIIEITRNSHGYRKVGCSPLRGIKSFWQHAPPLPQFIHLLMALFQLFAQQMMLSQLYRYGFINSGDFLNTELDFVYQRARQLAANPPMLDSQLQGFRISAQDLTSTPINPNLLPILMHAHLFGIPLEFVNLLISLFVYMCAYSTVFWHTNKPFSFIFSLHLLIYSMTVIWSYLGFSVLHRIQETNYANVRPIGLGQYLISSRPLKIYHPSAIITTYIMTIVLISIAPTALYMYGYSKYFISMSNVRQKSGFRSQASINGAQSEYSEYRLRSSSKVLQARLCCDGYAPHIFAIILLVLIVITKAPTIYAHMVIYQHEEKALLLSCIVIDIVFLFAWIILWLILTLKRDWNFKVVHQVHEIIALQNGPQTMITTPTQIIEKKPSELKNALILMHGDQMYITDDTITKKSLLRQTQKNGISAVSEGIYWLKENNTQSPTTRRIPPCESAKGTPEMNRLFGTSTIHRRNSDKNSSPTAAYHTIPHTVQSQMTHTSQQRIIMNAPKYSTDAKLSANVPGNTFGTFQRTQGTEYASCSSRQMLQNPPRPSLQNPMSTCSGNNASDSTSLTQQKAYASIHKNRTGKIEITLKRKRSSKDDEAVNNGFGNASVSYGAYNQQLMQQAAVQAAKAAQVSRNIGTIYNRTQTNTSQNIAFASPIAENRLRVRTSISSREHSLFQKSSNLKLLSFNSVAPAVDSHKLIGIQQQWQQQHQSCDAGSVYGNWSQQRQISQISQPVDWASPSSCDKASSATSTVQQEQCFTPTSTLTSQGSASNYSWQQTPVSGSPNSQNIYSGGRFANNGTTGSVGLYGSLGHEHDTSSNDRDRTLRAQQQPKLSPTTIASGRSSMRHQIKTNIGSSRQDDSANYSLTSSNESSENARISGQANHIMDSVEFATSIV